MDKKLLEQLAARAEQKEKDRLDVYKRQVYLHVFLAGGEALGRLLQHGIPVNHGLSSSR